VLRVSAGLQIQRSGGKGHVSAILSGKREITLKMAQKLKTFFGIPAEVFLQSVN